MKSLFQNYEALIHNGNTKLRQDALSVVDAGVRKVVPYEAVKSLIRLEGSTLKVKDQTFDLMKIDHIYVVGAGKGSFPMAQALDEILKERISEGIVIVKDGEKRRLPHIEIFESSHPIPDERSLVAADKMLSVLKKATENDLVFAAITGGSSAMVNKPAADISMSDLKLMNQELLNCGAEIGKINAVRKHICMIKGGRVVQYAQPANVITLTFDTAPPDMPWPDMCLPDPSSFADAIKVLKDYEIWNHTPETIKKYLIEGLQHPERETVKSLEGMKQTIYSVADPRLACEAAAKRAEELGYKPYILSTILEGEAKDLGITLAGITDEILERKRPFTGSCALISGGETTVTIQDIYGEGGPNQETVLGFVHKIRSRDRYVFVSMDSDGTDGPCNRAGGIADAATVRRVEEQKINLDKCLHEHNSTDVLKQLGDDLLTGHTGTNVMNLRVVLIEGEA